MNDIVDRISEGHSRKCPYCSVTRSDFQLEVAIALISSHIRREHPEARQ